jgi:hypothetical protein
MTKNVTFRFDDRELLLLDELRTDLGVSRTEAVVQGVLELRRQLGLTQRAGEQLVSQLAERFGGDAKLEFLVDSMFDVQVLANGKPVADLEAPTVVDDSLSEMTIYLASPDTDARLRIGALPTRAGRSITVPLQHLGADWEERR